MVAGRIAQDDCRDGFLLDGYPRTVAQARFFSRLLEQRSLPEPLLVHLDVPAEDLVDRLTARRQCPQCLRIFNLLSHPPRRAELCDDDGAVLIRRDDDCEAAIRERIRAYDDQTGPVLDWFGPTVVRRVDGTLRPRDVAECIEDLLGQPRVLSAK